MKRNLVDIAEDASDRSIEYDTDTISSGTLSAQERPVEYDTDTVSISGTVRTITLTLRTYATPVSEAPQNKEDRRIELPPGYYLSKFLAFLLPKKAYAQLVDPHVRDLHHEYIEAISKGERSRAQWIKIRGVGLLWWYLFRAPAMRILNLMNIPID